MAKESFNIASLVNADGCFNLQFRKDTRHERTNSPTYYRWKLQFVITGPKENLETFQKVRNQIGCGEVHLTKSQARFSVQKINDITGSVIPFFTKNKLAEKKKKDFELWQKAAEIIYKNKGKQLSTWKKNEFLQLIEIQKSAVKYKNKPRQTKWIEIAQSLAQTI